jgi:DNA-binding GntR family transcriptional regulator
MPVPEPGAGAVAASGHPDELRWRLVGAFRAGRFADGAVLPVEDLAAEFGVGSRRLRQALEYLRTIGHVRIVDDRSVVVTRPTFEDWADALRLMLGLLAVTVRSAVPVLDDDDRTALRSLVERVHRQGAPRDLGHTESSFAVHGFFADRTPNRLLGALVRDTMARVANALTPPPPFEQWETSGALIRLADAADEGDVESAVEAVTDLWPHLERHIESTRAKMEE